MKDKSGRDENKEVAGIVHKNTRTMLGLRQETEKQKGVQQQFAAAIARHAGSMPFVYSELIFITGWIGLNLGWIPSVRRFDPWPFPLLALITTVEAIFLAIFILVSQNRMSALEEKREELDLQINLLTEHEVTRLITLVDTIANHLKVTTKDQDLGDLKKETSPEQVLNVIEKEMDKLEKRPSKD